MPERNVDEFINAVCKKIKYKKACAEISDELRDHIYDHAYSLMENGVSKEIAFVKAVEAMGDAEELGINLNKVHRPLLGWIISITNTLIVILGIFLVITIIPSFSSMFESFKLPDTKEIKYSMNLNEKGKIDDRTIVIKKIILDKSNNVYIRFDEYDKFFYQGWSMLDFKVYDDLGNEYIQGGGESKGSFFVTRHFINKDNINGKAKKIILDYDYYNRRLKFEIPIT